MVFVSNIGGASNIKNLKPISLSGIFDHCRNLGEEDNGSGGIGVGEC